MELSDKVVEKIFLYLDCDTLKRQLVVKPFRRIILNSSKLMAKLPFILCEREWRSKLELLKNLGQYIVKIDFKESAFLKSGEELVDIFESLPNLEILVISSQVQYCYKNGPDLFETSHKSVLKNLRILKLYCAFKVTDTVIKYLWNKDDLEELLIRAFQDLDPTCAKFIVKQKKLKNLEIGGRSNLLFHELVDISEFQNVQFKLETLIFWNVLLENPERVAAFFKTQTDLKKLRFNHGGSVDHENFAVVLETFKNLKSLEFFVNTFEMEPLSDRENIKLESLENLRLSGTLKHDFFKNIIGLFPNIKQLHINNLCDFHFGFPEITEKIEKLSFNYLRLNSLLFVKFPRLRQLEVKLLNFHSSEDVVRTFFSMNPTIEELNIELIDFMETIQTAKFNLKIMLRNLSLLKNLKYLYFNCNVDIIQNLLANALDPEIEEITVFTITINRKRHPKQLKVNRFLSENFQNEFELLKNLARDCQLEIFE